MIPRHHLLLASLAFLGLGLTLLAWAWWWA